jgi:hypothetical protein
LAPGLALAEAPKVLFVLDSSGSMNAKIEGKTKMTVAKAVMGNLIEALPADVSVGLETYGHNRKDDCNDIEMLVPMGGDRATLIKAVNALDPKGSTPLTGAIGLAATQLREVEGSASVVVVSDGKETCGGDPCAAVREAIAQGVKMQVHVVGFDVAADEAEQLRCIAQAGNGKYFAAANSEELGKALAQVKEEVTPAPPTPSPAPAPRSPQGLLQDNFERDSLGESYEMLSPNRLVMSDGKLLIVATQRQAGPAPVNLALAQPPPSENFVATVRVSVPGMDGIRTSLFYWVGQENFLRVGPWGVRYDLDNGARGYGELVQTGPQRVRRLPLYRLLSFVKVVGGKEDILLLKQSELGGRQLKGEISTPETWYLQIERRGAKYTGRMSVDGKKWTEVGSHVIAQKNGRLGLGVEQDWEKGNEHPAEFDDFVIKGAP